VHQWQVEPGGVWDTAVALGGRVSVEVIAGVASNADGRLEVFGIALNGNLWHIWQDPATGSGWSEWENLRGSIQTLAPQFIPGAAVGSNADGRLEVFARFGNDELFHIWQVPEGGWSDWTSLGGQIFGPPAVGRNANGCLEAFARAQAGDMFHIWQLEAGGRWSDWAYLDGLSLAPPAVAANLDGRLEVFAVQADGALLHNWQLQPSGPWSGWDPLSSGNLYERPDVIANADGRIEVFTRSQRRDLLHTWQTVPNAMPDDQWG
jgi:hypothetical protein